LEFIPPEHPQRHSVLIGLASLLSERFNKPGRKENPDELITLKRAASGYQNRCRALLNLVNALHEHFQKQGTEKSIAEALSLARAASGLFPLEHLDHAYLEMTRLSPEDLANLLFKEFKKKEGDRDLDAIIMLGRTALEFTPSEHPQHHSTLIHLAGLQSKRFNNNGRKEDLDKLVTLKPTASEYLSPDTLQRQITLLELDSHLSEHFKRTDSTVDMEIISIRHAA
ncbi:hypothetical protein EDD16DRAFT_1487836, partial [Pisolithus croceorrhizus]